jgi:hypothetical protein
MPSLFVRTGLLWIAVSAAAAASAFAQTGPVANGALPGPFPLFPATNWWNLDVSAAPVDLKSAAYIAFIDNGSPRHLHPDFGGDAGPVQIYGMPYGAVDGTQPRVAVQFTYSGESDGVDHVTNISFPFYPIPDEVKTQTHWVEGGERGDTNQFGGDRHLLIVDRTNKYLYELYNVFWDGSQWHAGSGAFFDMKTNNRRPDTWTSADAAGLAILPGLVRYDEVSGPDEIGHAFRFTVRATNGYAYPASHSAGSNPQALPMGARLRLKASVDLSGFPADAQKIFRAMKKFGLLVADNGSDMFIGGTYDNRWDNSVLNPAFAGLTADDFEVIQLGYQGPPPLATAMAFSTLPLCRAVDTRLANGPFGGPSLAARSERVFTLAGRCGVPSSARAVSVNLTVTAPDSQGFLTAHPGGTSVPLASDINYRIGQTRANNAIIYLGVAGDARVFCGQPSGAVHFVLDVNGYFQ